MTRRYFLATRIAGNRVRLSGPEAHHLIHVMRARQGECVVLFDGTGTEFTAQVERIGRADADLTILARAEVDRELPLSVALGAPLPKGDRQRWLIEKAVELGVGRFVPLCTERSAVAPGARTLDRLRRTIIEASKQCGRNRLMEIAAPEPWSAYLAATQNVPRRLLAHPSTEPARPIPPSRPASVPKVEGTGPAAATPIDPSHTEVALAVGPEGGFTPGEVSLAVGAGWQMVDLGPRTLRIETAAILLMAILRKSR